MFRRSVGDTSKQPYFHLSACRRSSGAGIQSAIQGEWVFTRRIEDCAKPPAPGVSQAAHQLSGPIPVELGNLTGLTDLRIDSDTGLCLPPELQDTVFGQLAVVDNNVPLCAAVTALPLAALWLLAFALVVLGLRRNGMERQLAA